jgi:hypothetical protein
MSIAAGVDAAQGVSRPQSPYVGLVPYAEAEAAFFFGRSQEVEIVSANLRSARLTILYGPSGVGKSSLLMAGVVHGLREQARSATDESPFAVCTVRSWLDDPARAVQEASRTALQELVGDEPLAAARETLADSLRAWTDRAGTLLVVLDQFEEYFQYHPGEGDGERLTGFAAELARVINDSSLAVNVLLSIREDAWAKLDRFEGHIQLLFANYLRVDHLDLDAAREAIEGPIAAWNRTLPSGAEPYDVEPALVDAVLAAAGGGLALGGESAGMEATAGDRVEAPFLQLVLERLWRDTVADGAHVLTLARLEELGGARRIVENHLLEALGRLTPAEQDAASDCFRFLVSSSKTKIAHPAADLAEWTRRPETQVAAVLDKLCSGASGRILRAVAPAADEAQSVSYELFHDVLAEPILAWRRGHELARSRRAAHRRLVRVGSISLALIAVFAGLGVWALIERAHADRLFHKEQALYHEQQAASRQLRARVAVLERRKTHAAGVAAAQIANVKRLRKTNRSLKGETVRLRRTRDVLDRQISSRRAQSRELTTGITRFNGQNRVLAAKINHLDRESDQLTLKLADLGDEHTALVDDAGILKVAVGALNAQLTALDNQRDELSKKAKELGYREQPKVAASTAPESLAPRRVPKKAVVFEIPAALPGSDALRKRVEALERELARLLEQRARLTDEAAWLTKDNALLVQQRDALRAEKEHLETTRAALDSRIRRLRRTLEAARAEHERLSSQAAARVIRNRRRRHTVAIRVSANGALQGRVNEHVETIGSTQGSISQDRGEIRTLVRFIAPRVDNLLKEAKDPSQDPALAGLLAVKAYRLTPFGADDPAHPNVYNALWLALSRLDAKSARDLIAPVASPSGKVGTTQSALIVQKICAVVTRGFTQDEWSRFLPAGAPYDAKSSRPCP